MQMHEKIITAVSRTPEGIEWTSLKVKQDGTEPMQQDSISIPLSGKTSEEILASIELPENVTEHLKGDITIPLRTAELLMRVMEFPATDDTEIADMVGFQIDKISPFPTDQLAVSHEVLHQNEGTSLVLMAAAKRSCIDAIGDAFEEKGVRIHSIDARVLGWMHLLRNEGHIADEGCEILIIEDGVDFSLIVIDSGVPLAFRMLHGETDDMNVVEELAYEIGYTLTTLDSEREMPTPSAIQFWSRETLSASLRTKLSETTGLPVHSHQLTTLPPLSDGIVRRALSSESHIELIPREWIDHEIRTRLRKKFTLISSSIAAMWLIVLLIFFGTYKVRAAQLSRVQRQAAELEPAAKKATENRNKLNTLKVYTDRSDSALECLREVTDRLPIGDIEFTSYSYTKRKGVKLIGTAGSDDKIYDYFENLSDSELFDQLKDQSVNNKTSKGVRRAVFSVSLDLPTEEAKK